MSRGKPTALEYESPARDLSATIPAGLVGEAARWISVVLAIDAVPFAIGFARFRGWLSVKAFDGHRLLAVELTIAAVALALIVWLVRKATRVRGMARLCYAFLAFAMAKAGLFACVMLTILLRI